LACFLNRFLLDSYFRIYSGHTQLNATDLRKMKYPSLQILKLLGKKYDFKMNQKQIYNLLGEIK
ncbi:SAM-dependent methyltransferase, partial [Acinetobacter baumannii]